MPKFGPRDRVVEASNRGRWGVVEQVRRKGYDVWWSDTRAIEKSVPERRLKHAPSRRKSSRKDVRKTFQSHQKHPRHNPQENPMAKMTKRDFEAMFKEEAIPMIIEHYEQDGVPDRPARREAWNNTVDAYISDGILPKSAGNWAHPSWLETYGHRGRRRNPNREPGVAFQKNMQGITNGLSEAGRHMELMEGLFVYRLFGEGSGRFNDEPVLSPEEKRKAIDARRKLAKAKKSLDEAWDQVKELGEEIHWLDNHMRYMNPTESHGKVKRRVFK